MTVRNIVEIDEELCNGCGQCVPGCAEGALKIVEGKARLVRDQYCDGLGACLGHCPRGAISVIQREAAPFDEEAVHEHLSKAKAAEESLACGCHSSTVRSLEPEEVQPDRAESTLGNWPVQLNLVPLEAPFFDGADLLVMADCVAVAYPGLHSELLPGRAVVMSCPKFDDARRYADKLGEIIRRNDIRRVTVVHMEVPCCSGLNWIVESAVEASGRDVPVSRSVIGVGGNPL
jgi:NAD-dependent dihydropyrimidine dehydrogenase PreA subunit